MQSPLAGREKLFILNIWIASRGFTKGNEMPTKPQKFTRTQQKVMEGIEEELLTTEGKFRDLILKIDPDNRTALEAALSAAEPVAVATRAASVALAGDMNRAFEILAQAQHKRNKRREDKRADR